MKEKKFEIKNKISLLINGLRNTFCEYCHFVKNKNGFLKFRHWKHLYSLQPDVIDLWMMHYITLPIHDYPNSGMLSYLTVPWESFREKKLTFSSQKTKRFWKTASREPTILLDSGLHQTIYPTVMDHCLEFKLDR